MGNIKETTLILAAVVVGLIATVSTSYSSANVCTGGTCLYVSGWP